MRWKSYLLATAVGFVLALLVVLAFKFEFASKPSVPIWPSVQVNESQETHWFGDKRYQDFLAEGKKEITGKSQLLAAKVIRDEKYSRRIEKSIFKIKSDAFVEISYKAEYAFGFDLSPGKFDLQYRDNHVVLEVSEPYLLTQPGIIAKRFEVLNDGIFIDTQAEVIKLYEGLDAVVARRGVALAKDPAIQALCEKQLIAAVGNILRRRAIVVPYIEVVYTQKKPELAPQ